MPSVELPFATQSAESSVTQNSRETLINMYSEIEVSGKRLLRRQRAALRRIVANTGAKRAHEHNDKDGYDYLIIGSGLYTFDGTVLTGPLGTLNTTLGRCWIIFNDNGDAMISDGATGYMWNGTTLATISTPDNVPVGPLAYQGGFGIFSVPGTGQWYITGINNFTSVDALDFATAEAYPDALLRIFIDHSQAFLGGTRSIEVWQLTGGADFPFQPLVNSQIQRGLAAKNAICADDNTVFFLGEDRVGYRLEGYRPVRFTNGAVERAIQRVTQASLDDCEMFSYTSGGQKFIVLRFPNELTAQCNLATGLWNWNETYGYSDWQILGSAGGLSRYFSTPTGIVALDESLNQDEGGIMRRLARGAPGYANDRNMAVGKVSLDAEVGRAPIGVEPQVMLRFAPDAETFGQIKTRTLGLTGEYKHKAVWRNLGSGPRPTIEVSMTDNCRFSIMNVYVEAEAESD
jgi:hypothetical protein